MYRTVQGSKPQIPNSTDHDLLEPLESDNSSSILGSVLATTIHSPLAGDRRRAYIGRPDSRHPAKDPLPTYPQIPMPWDALQVADGNFIPGLSFGTVLLPAGPKSADQLKKALERGIVHIDIANFTHATELRKLLEAGRVLRGNVFVSARWQHATEPIAAKMVERLCKVLNFESLDLLLMNDPKIKTADIGPRWVQMEKAKSMGLVRNIGVMNFSREQIVEVFMKAKIRPAVNQILFNPYADPLTLELVELCQSLGMVIMAYDLLQPVTSLMPGILNAPLTEIAKRCANTGNKTPTSPGQVLLAWAKIKGVAPMLTKIEDKWPADMFEIAHVPSVLTAIDLKIIDVVGAERARRDNASALRDAAIRKGVFTVLDKGVGAVVNNTLGSVI
ncbi:NADP-dependent oxidoreductase domain-containing protein [Mycena amicta]|nr:NADP-dependent oxidoreductase domain-containing protein [Mycena amicta]